MNTLASILLAPLSVVALLGGLVMAVIMWLSPSGGGMFVGLGVVVGWFILGTANLVSWVLNLLWWLAEGRPRGLGWVVAVQGVPALAAMVVLATVTFQ